MTGIARLCVESPQHLPSLDAGQWPLLLTVYPGDAAQGCAVGSTAGGDMTQQMAASSFVPCTTATGPSTGFLSRLNLNYRRQLMALGERVPRGANKVLFAQGAPAARCFSVIECVVCLARGIGDDRRQIVGFALPGEALEIAPQQRHEVSAATIGPALVCEIARELCVVRQPPALCAACGDRLGRHRSHRCP